MASHATKMVREMSTIDAPVKTAASVNPTENEIATVAYQLWLDSGCPVGSDQEHWLRAEAMLKNAVIAKCEDLCETSIDPPLRYSRRVRNAGRVQRWDGHWEVWEMEWGGARWIWDVRNSGARVSNRAA